MNIKCPETMKIVMEIAFSQPRNIQGRIQPRVEGGGAICRLGAKNVVKSKRAEGAQKSLSLYSGKILWFFQLNNALIHMFPTFRTKHEKGVHLGQDKGRPSCRKWGAKLSLHHEGGGSCPQLHPLNPPLAICSFSCSFSFDVG